MRHAHLARVRSIMETPVLDERKWAKVPLMPTDAVLVDMEDTVAQARKLEGRAAVAGALEDTAYFGDRVLLCRPNGLTTEWWRDDVAALATGGAENVILPMITSAADVLEFQQAFRDHGADPHLIAGIETPGGVAHVEEIAEIDGVAGLVFGEGDLTAGTGLPILAPDGSINPMVVYARSRVYVAAAAYDLAMFDIPFVADIKNPVTFRARAEELQRMGATGLFAMYPPHVDIINDVFTPDDDAVAYAEKVIREFERAAAEGRPAFQFDDGKAVLIHDYKKAQGLLTRAGRA